MNGTAEKMLFFTGGILAGIVIVHVVNGRREQFGGYSKKSKEKLKPLDLRKDLKKSLSAYTALEYYHVSASLRNILQDDLNKDGTEIQKVIPNSIKLELEKRLHLSPAAEEVKEEIADVAEISKD